MYYFSVEEYLKYINNSSYFYQKSSSTFKMFKVTLPNGWLSSSNNYWTICFDKNGRLPVQGWKIHLSCNYQQMQKMLTIASSYLFKNDIDFKYTNNKHEWLLKNSKYADRAQAGKFITIYPENEQVFVKVIKELSKLLKSFKSGPYILSDREWQGSNLFYRYGAFKKVTKFVGNKEIYCILNPEGKKIEDKRVPYYYQPNFIKEPKYVQQNNFLVKGADTSELKSYQIKGALHFSDAGGVYLAEKNQTNYVLKEGRPMAGLDAQGRDGFQRLINERHALETLKDIKYVVQFHEYFRAWKHNYLVEKYLPGMNLSDFITKNYPFNGFNKEQYFAQAKIIAQNLISAINAIHQKGLAMGDLHPDNIRVIFQENDQPTIKLFDFEQAHPLKDVYHPGLMNPEFSQVNLKNYGEADLYALRLIIRYLFLPIINITHFKAGTELFQNKNIKKYFR